MILNSFHTLSILTTGIASYFSGSFVGKYYSCTVNADNGFRPRPAPTGLDENVREDFMSVGPMDDKSGPLGSLFKDLEYNNLLLQYDHRTRIARFACQCLTRENYGKFPYDRDCPCEPNKCFMAKIKSDERVDGIFRNQKQDFYAERYYATYLVPPCSGDDSTKVLPNIVLQAKDFRHGPWKVLHSYIQTLAKDHECVYVCTGPLFLPKSVEPCVAQSTASGGCGDSASRPGSSSKTTCPGARIVEYELVGPNKVSIPTHFFKALVFKDGKGCYEFRGFVMPNEAYEESDAPDDEIAYLKPFRVELNELEKMSGLCLFKVVRDTNKLVESDLVRRCGDNLPY